MLVTTKDGERHYIKNRAEMENLIERYMGEEIVEQLKDIEYDEESEVIQSDLDNYEMELEHCHNVFVDLRDELEEVLSKQRLDRQKLNKILETIVVNI